MDSDRIAKRYKASIYLAFTPGHRLIFGPRRGVITSGRIMPTVRSASRMRLF
jgi:hypothetical protein